MARVAVPAMTVALLATGAVAAAWPHPRTVTAAPALGASLAIRQRSAQVSRGLDDRPNLTVRGRPELSLTARPPAPDRLRPVSLKVTGVRYATAALNVRTAADAGAHLVAVLAAGSRVSVTASTDGEWQQVVRSGAGGWVKSRYLASKKPTAAAKAGSGGGISMAPCATGSAVERGLTRDAIRVHRAICARFPQVKSYGGVRPDSLPYHPSGRALDSMTSNSTLGWQIANWVRANAKRLGASEVIYSQHIWSVQRSSEGWRSMPDRGSATANHYDHVHVTVYGNAGTG